MTPDKPEVVGRAQFVRKLMKSGFTYAQACQAYETVMSTIGDGVVNGAYISLGSVGALRPVVVPPRTVRMGFIKKKGGVCENVVREYNLDSRIAFKFKIFKAFLNRHPLRWFSS